MNKPELIKWPAPLAVLALIAGAALQAQDSSQQVFELSPFEVDASEDSGYRATNTLAGSRLNTQLRDVAASVTVLTNEFMEDLGADDIETALAYVANAETGQTFEGGTTTAYIQGEQGQSPARNRIRGLSQADVTADFFGISNPHLDRYNVERVSIVRGPNSVLFGLGSPSGIINYITKKASVGRNFGSVGLTLDNFDTVRATFDANQVLIEDKLAVRLMTLYDDQGYQFDSAIDRDKRITVAATWKISDRTTLRANVEEFTIDARRPRFIPPTDNITRWVDGGSPSIDNFNNPGGGGNISPFFDELVGGGQLPAQFFTDLSTPAPDFSMRLENKLPNGSRLPTSQRIAFWRSSNPEQGTNFFLDPLVHDSRVFPYQDIDIAALPGNWQSRDGASSTFMLNHSFSDNFNIEVGYHQDDTQWDRLTQVIGQSNSIQIDPNVTLPNGDPNPNFMRPFIFGRGVGRFTEEKNDSFRVQASYELDFEEISDNSWLGLHRLSALYTESEVDGFTYAWEQRADGVNHPAWTEDELLNDSDRRAMAIYYVGDAVSPGQLHPNYTGFPTTALVRPGATFPLEFYDPELGGWTTEGDPVSLKRMVHRNAGWNIRDAEGIGVTLQSFFFNRKLVTMIGWRDDDVEGRSTSFPTPGADGLYSLNRDNWTLGEPLVTGDSTVTKGVVYHATDWLSFHANESENFVVSAPKVDILGRPIPASSGVGEDYGFSLNLLDGKANVRVNWFETSQLNSEDGGLGFVGFWRMRGFERGIYSRINNGTITGVDWLRWDGNTTDNYDRFPNVGDVRDFVAEGMEIEVVYNPNANWRVAFNASKQETRQQNTGAAMLEYIDLRQPYWDQFWDQEWNASRTVGEQFTSQVGSRLFPALAADGRISIDQAKWSANALTNYTFTDGRFSGFAVGGSMRWSDRRALGYALTSDADGNVITDLDQPFFGGDNLNVGVHASYRKKLFDDKIDWKIQFNIQNLIGDESLVPVRINPDGNTAGFRIGRDTIYRLSNTFRF